MQKKYFKCYFCKIGNSHFVPIEQKGKECRCCQAYNYFYNNNNNNHSNYNQRVKYNNNNNKNNNYNRNNNQNNKYYKKRNNRPHYQNISNNNNYRGNQESLINAYFYRTNNNFYNSPYLLNSPYNNISLNNNINHIPYGPNYIRGMDNILFNSIRHLINNNFKVEKNENKSNNIIKYSWLKKEKLTEKIMKENKDINDCTICLESLKENDDINILKCGHIFHYNCIEKVVDHHFSTCPNCRIDLKTGENQPKPQNIYPEVFVFPIYNISDDDDDDEDDEGEIFI